MVDGTREGGSRSGSTRSGSTSGSTSGQGVRGTPGNRSGGRPDAVDRGFLGTIDPMVIHADDGRVVWEMDSLAFLAADGSENVDDSLWRQSALTARHGLYEVTTGIYQVRGFDLSNLTLVEGDTGVIVVDPLISAETAAAALALYRRHRGDRPVTGLIYTHAHVDHFGGVLGVVEPDSGIPVVAPEHFLDNAVSENVYAGTAMFRRGYYYDGHPLARSATGRVGIGLGAGASTGTVGLVAPTLTITRTGQEEVLDGVRIIFQLTPGTECPSEMNLYFPRQRALCLAENATHTMHNLLTLRGAQVRDPRMWSRYLGEAMELFGHRSDVEFASHHWPTWGTAAILTFMTEQRDLYAYLHDQTVRLMNQGLIGSEIAENFEVPPKLAARWHARGYYGSVSHNVKAIYQRYLGWYDGNPAHLWQHPPAAAATRYVDVMGGVAAALEHARRYLDTGDLRFAVELASHAVFADPGDPAARELLATGLERLGLGAENATWRNAYLTGATELRYGVGRTDVSAAGLLSVLTVTQLFDTLAIRVVGPRAWNEDFAINWVITDTRDLYRLELSHGALIHYPVKTPRAADLSVRISRARLVQGVETGSFSGVDMTGDASVLARLFALLEQPDPDFPVVTP
ncbi:alkyl sulfatase dimerization domain-containing protein [Cryobacterium sp.]|jgi:alkyl sulfatase BDS1-like metallo-beta-lactamase superfamily hydrolase|uniref:alkyl/aryl-sulfatase n=1 Tax=Cryobacterium sp. TaxID=1926290 RepID=UPI00260B53F5|nr:alkyl sulfatase dimerization domain-containing protein [Cryobacterium sp.]MCU1447127.1 Alkyl sulfatase [Cryobacterium sp.]